MKRFIHCGSFILLLAALGWGLTAAHATDTTTLGGGVVPPQGGNPSRSNPILVISFPDPIQMHNMGIASDGTYYYTCNGGNSGAGQINTYDLNGNPVHSTPCYIDMRAIFYNPATGYLYAKSYDDNLYQVDPVSGAYSVVHAGIFTDPQSSPALTPDGSMILEQSSGTIRFLDFQTGALDHTLSGFYVGGYPSSEAVGTDGARIFTWDGSLVHVYDMSGNPIESYNLPQGNFGFSLKFVHGLLFASVDGGGGTGYWYGYDVGGGPVPVEQSSWGQIKKLYQ